MRVRYVAALRASAYRVNWRGSATGRRRPYAALSRFIFIKCEDRPKQRRKKELRAAEAVVREHEGKLTGFD